MSIAGYGCLRHGVEWCSECMKAEKYLSYDSICITPEEGDYEIQFKDGDKVVHTIPVPKFALGDSLTLAGITGLLKK